MQKPDIIRENQIKKLLEEERLSKTSDNIYYNAIVTNPSRDFIIPAQYVDNRVSAILKNPSDYYCAITRFKVPITSIPIMIFKDDYYYIRLSYNGVDYDGKAVYISNGVSIVGQNTVFTVQHFLDMINNTLATLYALVVAANPADPNVPIGFPPRLILDRVTDLITLRCRTEFKNTGQDGLPIPPFSPPNPAVLNIYFNLPLEDILLFQARTQPNLNLTQPQPQAASLIYVKDNGNNLVTIAGVNYYDMVQEHSTIYLLSGFSSIVFLSNSLGTKSELTPGIGGGDNQLSIIADFELLQDQKVDQGYAQFFQTGPYKWIDFDTHDQIRNIKIDAYWLSNDGQQLVPIYILNNQKMSLKLLFKKKCTVDNSK